METDSEQLLEAGVSVGARTFEQLCGLGYVRDAFDATVCHQVGGTHRKAMLHALELPAERDFTTFRWLGNTGSVALPTALALGLKSEFIEPSSRVALLGIGSGINSVMMSTTWKKLVVAGELDADARRNLGESRDTARMSD
jgi:3-oxoacyl-[acyl-carrier-protein] synthase-3